MLYDFANTAYTVMIVTFVYGVYFKTVVCQGRPWGDFLWGLNATVSLTLVALAAPVLGAMADHARGKKVFLVFFTLLCVVFSGALFFVRDGMIGRGMVLFILANMGFQGALVFYNAFLPELASEKRMNLISGLGWGVGYVGAIVIVLLSGPFLKGGFAQDNLLNVRLTFVMQAAFYLVFSVPVFLWLRDRSLGAARLRPIRPGVRPLSCALGPPFTTCGATGSCSSS
jgi:UMF1 family MFS transporter